MTNGQVFDSGGVKDSHLLSTGGTESTSAFWSLVSEKYLASQLF